MMLWMIFMIDKKDYNLLLKMEKQYQEKIQMNIMKELRIMMINNYQMMLK